MRKIEMLEIHFLKFIFQVALIFCLLVDSMFPNDPRKYYDVLRKPTSALIHKESQQSFKRTLDDWQNCGDTCEKKIRKQISLHAYLQRTFISLCMSLNNEICLIFQIYCINRFENYIVLKLKPINMSTIINDYLDYVVKLVECIEPLYHITTYLKFRVFYITKATETYKRVLRTEQLSNFIAQIKSCYQNICQSIADNNKDFQILKINLYSQNFTPKLILFVETITGKVEFKIYFNKKILKLNTYLIKQPLKKKTHLSILTQT
ncbi:unnamed protein product [Paramecium octaurelia]|uniref:Uncharacterized protein n=1 Tax=Paramecium octaurelia TaxID=43137 RepID=A0A8S1UW49_PAROT|nr:unnamed protein product [Paramecium octaurelia]